MSAERSTSNARLDSSAKVCEPRRGVMSERMNRVRILLATSLDYLPSPQSAGGLLSLAAGVGAAPAKRVPCDLCLRTGRVKRRVDGRFRNRLCPICSGSGWRKRRPGDQEWDEYTEQPLREKTLKRHTTFRVQDDIRHLTAQINQLERDENLRNGNYLSERYFWEGEKERRERYGDYAKLDVALESLRRVWPEAWAVIFAMYFRGLDIQMSERHRDVEGRAVSYLADNIDGEIRVPSWLLEERAKKRQLSARELSDKGLSPSKIGFILGISRKKVKRLLAAA